MSEKQKYEILLAGLAELLNEKNTKIMILEYQLSEAKKALEAAEKAKSDTDNCENKEAV